MPTATSAERRNTSARSSVDSSVSQPFTGTHHPFGQVALGGDQLVDPVLERAGTDELAHQDVLALADAERPVGRLVLHGRVPPAVEMDHMVGGGQVEARSRLL